MNNIADVAFDTLFFIVICIAFANYKRNTVKDPIMYRLFYYLLITLVIIVASDTMARLAESVEILKIPRLNFIINSIFFTIQPLFWFLSVFIIDYWDFNSKEHMRRWIIPASFFLILQEVVAIVNMFTDNLFDMELGGINQEGSLYLEYLVLQVFQLAFIVLCALLGWDQAKTQENKQRAWAMVTYLLLPICGLLYISLGGCAPLFWPLTAVSFLLALVKYQQQVILKEEYNALKEKERITALELQLKKQGFSVMLSQIRPHFLFNVLSSLRGLCVIDPEKAEEGIIQFSNYLRGNLKAVSNDKETLIPAKEEFAHIDSYIALEKMRFMERLDVEKDIQTVDFYLPALGLQPFVENAIRYGVTQRQEGGTVKLATWEDDENWYIRVEDDGVGADPYITRFDGRTKLGIDAAVERLELACYASTEVNFVPQQGTTVLIKIPKKENLL